MGKLFLTFFILFPCIILAQEEGPTISSAYEEEAILEFIDGTQIEGHAMIRHRGFGEVRDVIKFRVSADSEADIWDETMCTGVFIRNQGILHEYKYVWMRRIDAHPELLKVFSEGSVMLYGDVSLKPTLLEQNITGRASTGDEEDRVTFYLKKEGEEYPVKLTGMFGWRKAAKEYFKDCPELIEKIESKEFTTKNIPEMVDFYNNTCGN